MLNEIHETVQRIASEVGPSVVGVGRRGPQGTGVIIADGTMLTNAHNVRGETLTVTFDDGRTEKGRVLGADYDADLAVVSVDTGTATAIADGAPDVDLGTPVVALSNPGGMGLRVTVGYVSGTERSFRGPRGRVIKGSLEHTAPLLPGSSGGPVVDRDGRLLGINTNRLGEGFYLAIPSGDHLTETVDRLREGETSSRVRLGVGVAPNEVVHKLRRSVGLEPVDGLLIRHSEDGSPAENAGIREGDVLVTLNGATLNTVDDLYDALADIEAGITVVATLVRGVEELEIEVGF